jgi:fumarate reductase subunit C
VNARLYLWQRGTAALMAPMILVHLLVIFYATRMRLTAADILSRTQGSIGWGLFYGAFVILASIHAAIGCRTVLREWGGLRGVAGNVVAVMIGLILLGLGLRAVAAVVLP